MTLTSKANELLAEFKGDRYLHGSGVLPKVGAIAKRLGSHAVLVADAFPGSNVYAEAIRRSLANVGVELSHTVEGPRPNAPREDVVRIARLVAAVDAEILVSFGGGSTIDATKAAEVLRSLGGDIEDYFGTGLVTQAAQVKRKALAPHIAIQTAASSGAHLTKYSNITDVSTGQKKLIVDDAIVPSDPVFDFSVTYGAPKDLTMDGALDGISHCLEVLYGAVGKPNYAKIREVTHVGIKLVVENLQTAIEKPTDRKARDALCLATDMGAYAIMLGGTNGGHLTSFSLVDVLSHGRACAIMNPYYTVFFAPAIEDPLRMVGEIYRAAGNTDRRIDKLGGRELGEAVADAMFELARRIGFPTTLGDVDGFTDEHIERALSAAKNPQLEMKLKNMPVALDASMIDDYMAPVLDAARKGDLSLIRNVAGA